MAFGKLARRENDNKEKLKGSVLTWPLEVRQVNKRAYVSVDRRDEDDA
jgi:hypothetical protein